MSNDATTVRALLYKYHNFMRLDFAATRDIEEAQAALERIIAGQRLIATTPHKILSVAVCGDRLVVCTDAGVFSGAPNGPLHELKLMPNIDDLRRKAFGPDQ